MKRFSFYILALIALSLVFTSCNKSTTSDPQPEKKGNLVLKFDNVVGNSNLVFNTNYTNAAGNTFNINMLRYFISNIKLTNSNGQVFVIPQDKSYFLVDESIATSQKITLTDIPEGDYSQVSFTIGVDSLRSTKPVEQRTGALDVSGQAAGMYWSWNSGYIVVKIEGTSPQSTATNNTIKYHIGGFGGYSSVAMNNIKTTTLSFGNDKASVRENRNAPEAHILVDILKVFNGTTNFNFATQHTVMSGNNSKLAADNYVSMFSYDHMH
jgi:hypothetical protein